MTDSVADVAAHILAEAGEMAAMKLHRLCFYAYGYHLAWESRRLFPEPFHAWANGPVVPALYELHRGRFLIGPGDILGDPGMLDDDERESIRAVLDALGALSAHDLSLMTHREQPWILARERSGAVLLERSGEPLRDDEIFEHFEALAATVDEDPCNGPGPLSPQLPLPEVAFTIHDRFLPGDAVRLVHHDDQRREFVTEQTLTISKEAISATFGRVTARPHISVIIDRAVPKDGEMPDA